MRKLFATLVTLSLAFLCSAPQSQGAQVLPKQGQKRTDDMPDEWGRQKLVIPQATTRGDWTGTWFYVSRDYHVALWLNDSEGAVPEVKVRLFRLGGGEQFVTDWSGHGDYNVRGAPGRFDFRLLSGDRNILDGEWDWTLDFADSSRTESAKIKVYRTGDGRRLTLRFDDLVRTIRRGAVVNEVPLQQIWVFRKASKRLVEWTELPF